MKQLDKNSFLLFYEYVKKTLEHFVFKFYYAEIYDIIDLVGDLMKQYEISLNDIDSNYFHFTWKNSLESIEEKGLIPKKGKHAGYVEETEKVFFVQGLDNLLILFDCWINIYRKEPLINLKPFYKWGSTAMTSKYFPTFLIDIYFMLIKNSRRHKKHAYEVFDRLLDECVLLNLDLEENIDFSFDDIDQIKGRGYRKRHLIELGYSLKYSDMESNKMDMWNLHTLTNKGVEPKKLKLCSINNSTKIRDIFNYAIENTKLDLQEICPNIYEFCSLK